MHLLGMLIGAVDVSGATANQDEDCAKAALARHSGSTQIEKARSRWANAQLNWEETHDYLEGQQRRTTIRR